ncbi:MAG: hypothetical protein Q9N26_08765 [Aquificota bacterium]|nr:hypothetical protein [Aquificota bacterium]
MKKMLLGTFTAFLLSVPAFSQMMGGQMGPMMMMPYGYYMPMMPMMMMPMMGGMMMMQDPETMKIIREHQMQCKRELMRKLATRPAFIEKMIHILVMNPDAVKRTLEKNPELKEKMRELLR